VKFYEQAIFPCEEFFGSSLWIRSLEQVFTEVIGLSLAQVLGSRFFGLNPEMFFGIKSLHQVFLDQVLGSGRIKSLDQVFGSSLWLQPLDQVFGSSP
jgi:hypothetical protein